MPVLLCRVFPVGVKPLNPGPKVFGGAATLFLQASRIRAEISTKMEAKYGQMRPSSASQSDKIFFWSCLELRAMLHHAARTQSINEPLEAKFLRAKGPICVQRGKKKDEGGEGEGKIPVKLYKTHSQ